MATTEAVKTTWIGRAARMLLVFVLVFGTSFRVEMALAAGYDFDYLKNRTVGEDVLTNLSVYTIANGKFGDRVTNDITVPLDPGEPVEFAGLGKWKGEDQEELIATYVEWEVGGESLDETTYAVTNDLKRGEPNQEINVVCQLNDDALAFLPETKEKDDRMPLEFTVLLNAPPLQIDGLTVYQGEGEVTNGAELPAEGDGPVGFEARLDWADQAEGVGEFVKWTVNGNEIVGNELSVSKEDADGEGKVSVTCEATDSEGVEVAEGLAVGFTVAFQPKGDDPAGGAKLTGLSVVDDQNNAVADGAVYPTVGDTTAKFTADLKWDLSEGATEPTGDLVEWTVADDDKDMIAAEGNACTVTGELGDTVEVTCKPTEAALKTAAEDDRSKLEKGVLFTVSFTANEKTPRLSMELSGKDENTGAVLDMNHNDRDGRVILAENAEYQLFATVKDADNAVPEKAYSSERDGSLYEFSRHKLTDLKWTITREDSDEPVDKDVAEINEATGVLTAKKEGKFKVACTTKFSEVYSCTGDMKCRIGEEKPGEHEAPDQGDERNSQKELRVTGVVASDAVAEDAPGLAPSSSSSSSQAKPSTSSSSAAGQSSSSSSAAEQPADSVLLDKTYSVAEVEALPAAEKTYDMRSATGTLKVTGQGTTLESLLKSLGIENMQAVHELEFTDYAEVKTKVSWPALSAGEPVVATKSYVHDTELENQSGSQAGASGAASGTAGSAATSSSSVVDKPLPNTCFRIIYDSAKASGASIDADALRYIKEIRINPGDDPTPVPQPEDPEAPFTVSIAYAPAPLGFDAVLSPIVSREIAGATFDFLWEESSDEGKTWKTAGANQTLKVKTTKKNLGHLFRVTVNSDLIDPDTQKNYKAISEPVKLKEPDDGFSVQLNYDPPIAGGIALFQSIIIDLKHDVDATKLEYVWEMSEDGCKTWEPLAKQYQGKSTLSIQTDPIDPNEPAGDAADANLIYIRVRVVEKTGQKRVRISNEQPLTVHVGDTEKGTGEQEKNNSLPSKDSKPVDLIKDPTWNNSAPSKRPGDSLPTDELDEDLPDYPSNSRVVEDVEDIEDVDENDNSEDAEGETNTAPTPDGSQQSPQQQANTAPQLHINEGVTQQILEQQEAVQEYVESTVPGARWTALQSSVASGDDARAILSDNPFAPLVIPTGLGITAAGVVEKLLFFRRQIK